LAAFGSSTALDTLALTFTVGGRQEVSGGSVPVDARDRAADPTTNDGSEASPRSIPPGSFVSLR